MARDTIKQQLLEKIDFRAEFTALLGKGKANTHKCFNKDAHSNGDKNPSLSASYETGSWKCHSCGEKGDIFSLHMKIKSEPFPKVYASLLEKYGMWRKIPDWEKDKNVTRSGKSFKTITASNIRGLVNDAMQGWTSTNGEEKLEFMRIRYGLTPETLKRWRVGYASRKRRVTIPIWATSSLRKDGSKHSLSSLAPIVNVRFHDCFRSLCQWYNKETDEIEKKRPVFITLAHLAMQETGPWQPLYSGRTGKVINQRGHGAVYLYPFEILQDNAAVYLVGGELKALLLNQLGIPAVTFTGGEGSFNDKFLPYFIGKSVRIIFDADKEKPMDEDGLSPTDRKAIQIGKYLANSGAYVEWAYWPDFIRENLPDGGDVTDLLRKAEWNTAALDLLEWRKVERDLDNDITGAETVKTLGGGEEIPALIDMKKVSFGGLTNAEHLNQWVRFEGLLSGRGEAPYVIPSIIEVTCRSGEASLRPKCVACTLPNCGFRRKIEFDTMSQVDLVGTPLKKLDSIIGAKVGIPKRCKEPEIEIKASAAEVATFVPTIEVQEDHTSVESTVEFGHRSVYVLNDDPNNKVKQNTPYEVGGKVISDPKRGTFTFAATTWRRKQDDVLTFKKNSDLHDQLKKACRQKADTVLMQMLAMRGEVRDHVVRGIHGADEMLETLFLSWFMPFTFNLGHQRCERICPGVMVLGDTNTGKSTTWSRLLRHYGAGRMVSADSDPTFAGLVGGNRMTGANRQDFAWGVLPTSHGAIVGVDEYNKLPVETIGKLTATVSSGIAERRTNSGTKRARCWVRLVYLCNPRTPARGHARRLTSYENPMDAAQQVVGTVQDLGRLDVVHIQLPVTDHRVFAGWHDSKVEHHYDTKVARYHLSWAWTRKPSEIVFEDPKYVFEKSIELSEIFGGTDSILMLPAQARWKLGKVAAACAGALYSYAPKDISKMLVKREHVDWAVDFYKTRYEPYIKKVAGSGNLMPSDIVSFLDRNLKNYYKLRLLATESTRYTFDDFQEIMGSKRGADKLLDIIYFKHGMVAKRGGWYIPKQPEKFSEIFEGYVMHRDRIDSRGGL